MPAIKQGQGVLVELDHLNEATAGNVSKTAQDVNRDISEPPQSTTKPRGGIKKFGAP